MLYKHYNDLENSGGIGVLIIIIVYGGILLLNGLLFYNYLVFLHMDGRIIDIFTRVTAKNNYFFVPLDNEVSARYLRWVVTKVRLENRKHARRGEAAGSKVFAVTAHAVSDLGFEKKVVHVSIYRRRGDGRLVLFRHFMQTREGTICELEEGSPFTVDEHPLLEKWPANMRRRGTRKFEASPTRPVQEEVQEEVPGAYTLDMQPEKSSSKELLDFNEE